ncbi:MAG: DUF4152 domain-containing protein [Candidatus Korarchaeota archaeon]|nr:DUF4152 domain-containing protein [Candidatus Korarchaeota archaeon]
MRVIAADSSSAILDEKFKTQSIVAAASVLVNPPYREPDRCLAEPIFADAKKGHEVVVHEAELCKKLLEKTKADTVHLDISLGAIPIERLSPIQLSQVRVSSRARRHLIKILPKLRKIAGEITQRYGIEVLAIGKESVPVRIAELTAGAHAIIYACNKALEENHAVLLGLPLKCQPIEAGNRIYLQSLLGAEHDLRGCADEKTEILKKVRITEILNPVARGFRTLRITQKEEN